MSLLNLNDPKRQSQKKNNTQLIQMMSEIENLLLLLSRSCVIPKKKSNSYIFPFELARRFDDMFLFQNKFQNTIFLRKIRREFGASHGIKFTLTYWNVVSHELFFMFENSTMLSYELPLLAEEFSVITHFGALQCTETNLKNFLQLHLLLIL